MLGNRITSVLFYILTYHWYNIKIVMSSFTPKLNNRRVMFYFYFFFCFLSLVTGWSEVTGFLSITDTVALVLYFDAVCIASMHAKFIVRVLKPKFGTTRIEFQKIYVWALSFVHLDEIHCIIWEITSLIFINYLLEVK